MDLVYKIQVIVWYFFAWTFTSLKILNVDHLSFHRPYSQSLREVRQIYENEYYKAKNLDGSPQCERPHLYRMSLSMGVVSKASQRRYKVPKGATKLNRGVGVGISSSSRFIFNNEYKKGKYCINWQYSLLLYFIFNIFCIPQNKDQGVLQMYNHQIEL